MVGESEINHSLRFPCDEARREAMLNPGGWVYEIDGQFDPNDAIPPWAVVGAWKVDEHGQIQGEFIPNPNHRPFKSEMT